jgi:rubrerythrin
MKDAQVTELLLQALETELGGTKVYMTAIKCTTNKDLKQEFTEYLDQTRRHVEIVKALLAEFGLDPKATSPGREVVRRIGRSLVGAMQKALAEGPPEAAQLVAAECVTLAETKDHLNWELIGEVAGKVKGERGKALKSAHKEVEEQEDEHLYHSAGWTRELWVKSLGLRAVLPPPEEQKDVKTAIGAARAKQARGQIEKSLNGRPVSSTRGL